MGRARYCTSGGIRRWGGSHRAETARRRILGLCRLTICLVASLVLATLVRREGNRGYICILEVHCHDRTIYPSADTPGGSHGLSFHLKERNPHVHSIPSPPSHTRLI